MKLLAAQVTVPVSGSLEPIHQKQHQCLHLSERLYSFPLSHSTPHHLFFFPVLFSCYCDCLCACALSEPEHYHHKV